MADEMLFENGEPISFSHYSVLLGECIDGLDIKEGQFIGLVEGKVRYTADTLYDCVDKLAECLEGKSCITAYCGDEMDDKGVGEIERELEMLFGDNTDVTVIRGGQPVYTLILSAE